MNDSCVYFRHGFVRLGMYDMYPSTALSDIVNYKVVVLFVKNRICGHIWTHPFPFYLHWRVSHAHCTGVTKHPLNLL